MKNNNIDLKQQVLNFWNKASCGEALYTDGLTKESFERQLKVRYELEGSLINSIAHFESACGLKVLEIGVGLGADHQRFAESGAQLYGIDLTDRAISNTKSRFELLELSSNLSVGDAENLNFEGDTFDQVYSWGVLHHSPDTEKAVSEVWRVLKFGGVASIMIYHKWSVIGAMLWVRYGLLRLRPWLSLEFIYSNYLESPGTKAYTIHEARLMFKNFSNVKISTPLTHGDLLESNVGQRHRGPILATVKKIWPRWLIKRLFPKAGLFMLIEARK